MFEKLIPKHFIHDTLNRNTLELTLRLCRIHYTFNTNVGIKETFRLKYYAAKVVGSIVFSVGLRFE